MAQLRQYEDEFSRHNFATAMVTFDSESLATRYVEQTKLDWPVLLDRRRTLYKAYSLGCANWWALYSPSSILRYLKMMAAGHRIGTPGEDWRQLGGNVVIDPKGIIRMHHISTHPHDRPSVEDVLKTWRS